MSNCLKVQMRLKGGCFIHIFNIIFFCPRFHIGKTSGLLDALSPTDGRLQPHNCQKHLGSKITIKLLARADRLQPLQMPKPLGPSRSLQNGQNWPLTALQMARWAKPLWNRMVNESWPLAVIQIWGPCITRQQAVDC